MDFSKPEYYMNRELSWLQFNDRILLEAKDKSNKLFERLKFLSITASNLDEFFMVRVASLKDMVEAKYSKPDGRKVVYASWNPADLLRNANIFTYAVIAVILVVVGAVIGIGAVIVAAIVVPVVIVTKVKKKKKLAAEAK